MKFLATNTVVKSPEIPGFGNDTIKVTKRYLTKNSIPWLPAMGEFHYSRCDKADWENELIKMKNSGIEIVSSYVLWIHHEAVEGIFDWTGNNDLRRFIALCEKHSLYFFLRPGPWAHGECRNGGFPDWLLGKCGKNTRCVSEPYLSYVKKLFIQIAKQVEGFSNIIGIQADNELIYNPECLLAIKKLILDCGMNAPLFTATAWGWCPNVPSKELLPVYGGYPEAPWEQHTDKLPPNSHYFFTHERNDNIIGSDLMTRSDQNQNENKPDYSQTPFLTCEAGGGIQVTYHRRPIIQPKDISVLAFTLLGSGCNLLGYYMYHGGKNPVPENSTLQESKETGYPNDYPIVSYDFQSSLGDCGQFRESYNLFSELHSFTKCYGTLLCTMDCVLPNEPPTGLDDNTSLRSAIRTDGKSGFVFINNYQRLQPLPHHENVQIEVELANETITLSGINVLENSYFILPVNLCIGEKLLKYSLAQPLSIEGNVWSFLEIEGMEPRFYFEDCEFVLTNDGYMIGDIELRLVRRKSYVPTTGKEVSATLVENSIAFDRFKYLGLANNTKEYLVKWGEDFAYLKVDVVGNIAQAYHNQKLVADWFCNSNSWIIDVRKFRDKELVIKVQPLLNDDVIYFEAEMMRNTTGVSVVGLAGGEVYL